MADLSKLSDEALEDKAYTLMAQRDAIRESQLELQAERGHRAHVARAEDLLKNMSDDAVDVLIAGATARASSNGADS